MCVNVCVCLCACVCVLCTLMRVYVHVCICKFFDTLQDGGQVILLLLISSVGHLHLTAVNTDNS